MKTKKLISNLKKEIEKLRKKYSWNRKGMRGLEKSQIKRLIKLKIAQLLFAEKLIKAIKGDIKEFIKRDMEESKKAIINCQTGAEAFVDRLEFELNKILDEAIK